MPRVSCRMSSRILLVCSWCEGLQIDGPMIAVYRLDYRTNPCVLFKPEQFQAVSMNQRFYLVPV